MFEAEDKHWWYVGNRENFIRILLSKKLLKDGVKLLDAGCGTGGWLHTLKKSFNIHEVGMDNHEIAINYSRSRTGLNLVRGDLNNDTFEASSFDLITCFDVIYHREVDETRVIKNFHKYLKNGGYVLLTAPAYSFLYSKHDVVVHTKKRYTRKQVRALFESNSFEISKISYCLFLMFPFALLKRFFDKFSVSNTEDHNEVELPPKTINRLLLSVMRLENFISRFIPFPFGLSVLVLAKKIPGERN